MRVSSRSLRQRRQLQPKLRENTPLDWSCVVRQGSVEVGLILGTFLHVPERAAPVLNGLKDRCSLSRANRHCIERYCRSQLPRSELQAKGDLVPQVALNLDQ